MEYLVEEDYDEIQTLHSKMSKLAHEEDLIKHNTREVIRERYFLPVERSVLINF